MEAPIFSNAETSVAVDWNEKRLCNQDDGEIFTSRLLLHTLVANVLHFNRQPLIKSALARKSNRIAKSSISWIPFKTSTQRTGGWNIGNCRLQWTHWYLLILTDSYRCCSVSNDFHKKNDMTGTPHLNRQPPIKSYRRPPQMFLFIIYLSFSRYVRENQWTKQTKQKR